MLDDGRRIIARYNGQTLFEYVYLPDVPAQESPKPYFHPLYSLAGDVLTGFRPHDHPWHHGLALTLSALSGQNFWGGPSYVRDQGYTQLDNNGRIAHQTWESLADDGGVQHLVWITAAGESWLEERREIRFTIETSAGWWCLDWRSGWHNVSGRALVLGSPTTEGRPLAGYGGLFWRGARDLIGGKVLAGGDLIGEDAINGQAAPWLAFIGQHDGSLRWSTLIFQDHPQNPRYPTQWFARSSLYPGVSFAFMYDTPWHMAAGSRLDWRYRLIFANGAWTQAQIEGLALA